MTGCCVQMPVSPGDDPAWAYDAAVSASGQNASATSVAADVKPAVAPAPRATMTGDWGGVRTRLADAGLDIDANYVSETMSAIDGGLRRGTTYAQTARLNAHLDLDKIAGWSGALVHISLNDRRGAGISSDFVGNKLQIQQVAGGYFTRLTEFSYEQNLAGGKLNWRLGYFSMGNERANTAAWGCDFLNATFCAHPVALSANSGWYNYPAARWGAGIRYRLRPDVVVSTGIYQVNPELNVLNKAIAFNPFGGHTIGAIMPAEVEYDPGIRPNSHVLPGHYKIGAYYDTSRVARQGNVGTVRGRYGLYFLADQMILRGKGAQGLSIFFELTVAPKSTAQVTRGYQGGFFKVGTFRGRDADTVALGFAYAELNPRLRRVHAESEPVAGNSELPAGETLIELSYDIRVRRWLSIRSDVQYVLDPGTFGYRATQNALVLGGQIKVEL